ncbi:MAG TPA: hypothetical protein VF503_01195 [Sphingobium sp.]|uniref:hypothetical protein n=1 Tax=Sphingobium sp. TaxID=1912891 RepID=UPI002ED22C64
MAFAEHTKIPLEQSIAEIIGMCRRAGASQIGQMEDEGEFVIMFRLDGRSMKFTVPLATSYAGPERHANNRLVDQVQWVEQRNRQKGRALMLVIKAKLESVESGVETFEQAFLANIVTGTGQTVHERISDQLKLEYDGGQVKPLLLGGPS